MSADLRLEQVEEARILHRTFLVVVWNDRANSTRATGRQSAAPFTVENVSPLVAEQGLTATTRTAGTPKPH
jgi:hypothetical protein